MGRVILMADARHAALLAQVQGGLPLVSSPYAELGRRVGLSEREVIELLSAWMRDGVIKRMGVVVRHRSLGYDANAMVVWDVPDDRVSDAGRRMRAFEFVTLCYRRPRAPSWPYNLFCMIHGKDRGKVIAQTELLAHGCGLGEVPREMLFSRRCFKQRGAYYASTLGQAAP